MRDLGKLLKLHMELIKLVFQNYSFQVQNNIKENVSAIKNEEFQKTTKVLYECRDYEDSQLIYTPNALWAKDFPEETTAEETPAN